MADIEPGNKFKKTRTAYVDGWPTTAQITVTVLKIVDNYTDTWSGETFAQGVVFKMDDSIGGLSYHSLSLDLFRNAWAG